MFGHPPRRALWLSDETAPKRGSADTSMSPVSYKRYAYTEVDANELLIVLESKLCTAEALVLKATLGFVNAIANQCPNMNDMIGLIEVLESFKKSHANEKGGAYGYCTVYLAENLPTCTYSNPQFKNIYAESPLKKYLDSVVPPQSPPRFNTSPSKR